MPLKDYYAILQVPHTASPAQIRRAYRRLARQHHPDLNPDAPEAVERQRDLNEAYAVLSNPARRAAYERERARAAASPASVRASPAPGAPSAWPTDRPPHLAADLGPLSVAARPRPGRPPAPSVTPAELSVLLRLRDELLRWHARSRRWPFRPPWWPW